VWDAGSLARQFKALHIPGVAMIPFKYEAGGTYSGVYFQIDPRNAGNLTALNFYAIDILQRNIDGFSPFSHLTFDQRDMFNKVTGDPRLRGLLASGYPVSRIVRSWDSGVVRWAEERLPYLLYGNSASSAAPTQDAIASSPDGAP
jgi:uncharacterized protein YbbC (DUF1343 family)